MISVIAKNLVKTRSIRENFSKRGDFICLFAKISVSLQRKLCDEKFVTKNSLLLRCIKSSNYDK